MRLLICAALAVMAWPAAGQPARQSRDEAFVNEIAIILSAAYCANPLDEDTLRLLGVLMSASRVRNYGPDPDRETAARISRVVASVQDAARAGVDEDPRARCFNIGRRLERLLPR